MDHIAKNRGYWDRHSAAYQQRHEARLPTDEPTWGIWGLRESELRILGDVRGKDVLELGCGGAQWSVALARRGARGTGLDLSSAQLEHARSVCAAAGVDVRLVHASAEATGLPDESFDVVFCDHGATTFADPERVVPEVARLLRPGGLFAFNASTPWLELCWPPGTPKPTREVAGDYFALGRQEDDESVWFSRGYGAWIRLFGSAGLAVEDLVELVPPADATTSYDWASVEWCRRLPSEQIWKVRKVARSGAGRRTFSVAIFARHAGRVLLVAHRRLGTWLPVGGELEPGETPLEAARRELCEETGLEGEFAAIGGVDGSPAGLLGYEEHRAGDKGLHMNFAFVAEVASASVAANHEFGAHRWVTADEALELDCPLNVKQLVALALRG